MKKWKLVREKSLIYNARGTDEKIELVSFLRVIFFVSFFPLSLSPLTHTNINAQLRAWRRMFLLSYFCLRLVQSFLVTRCFLQHCVSECTSKCVCVLQFDHWSLITLHTWLVWWGLWIINRKLQQLQENWRKRRSRKRKIEKREENI